MTVTHLACHNNNGINKSNESVDKTFRKVYVGNVLADMSGERLLDHFASYGEVEEGPMGADKTAGKFRGFAFFIYKNEEGARACLLDPNKNIEGHQLHCRLAITRKVKALIAAKAPTPSPSAAAPLAPSAAPLAPAAAPSAPAAAPSAPAAASSAPDAAPPVPAAAPWGLSPHSVNLNPGSVSGQFSYGINASGVAAPLAATAAQLRGSDNGVKPEVVNSNHQSSMNGSFVSQFGGREPSGVSAYAGNVGGSGLPGGQCGTFGYGGGRQGLPLGHSLDPLSSNLGSRIGSSFGGIAGFVD